MCLSIFSGVYHPLRISLICTQNLFETFAHVSVKFFHLFLVLICMGYLFCTLFSVDDLDFHSLLMFSLSDHNFEADEHIILFFMMC